MSNVKRLPLERSVKIPEDLRDTWDYIVETDVLGDFNMTNAARAIVRKCTLGEAIVALRRERPDIKCIIRMPEPRWKPWRELPALMIGGRPPPGVTIRLEGKARANLLELLKLCGFSYLIHQEGDRSVRKNSGVEPFTFAGGAWLAELGLKLEGDPDDDPIDVEPDFTIDELRERVQRWREK